MSIETSRAVVQVTCRCDRCGAEEQWELDADEASFPQSPDSWVDVKASGLLQYATKTRIAALSTLHLCPKCAPGLTAFFLDGGCREPETKFCAADSDHGVCNRLMPCPLH